MTAADYYFVWDSHEQMMSDAASRLAPKAPEPAAEAEVELLPLDETDWGIMSDYQRLLRAKLDRENQLRAALAELIPLRKVREERDHMIRSVSSISRELGVMEGKFEGSELNCDALRAEVARLKVHMEGGVEWERRDCGKALRALSGAGVCTPAETYGTNVSWAVSDRCRALNTARQEARRKALEEAASFAAHSSFGCPITLLVEQTKLSHGVWLALQISEGIRALANSPEPPDSSSAPAKEEA